MRFHGRRRPVEVPPSGFAGFRFPAEVILLAIRWYLRFGLSYRDLEELLAERGVEVDHVTLYRWVQGFTPQLVDAARPAGIRAVTAGSWTKPTSRCAERKAGLSRQPRDRRPSGGNLSSPRP